MFRRSNMPRIKISTTQRYPILPRHLSSNCEPKGFDELIPVRFHRLILWSLIRYWKFIGCWREISLSDFISFSGSDHGKFLISGISKKSLLGIINWRRVLPKKLINIRGKNGSVTFSPTRTLISMYFLHNDSTESPTRFRD